MHEIPLYGAMANGRVALVDDEDAERIGRFRWRLYELERPGRRPQGPYAHSSIWNGQGQTTTSMHIIVMGQKFIDHIDGDGLNNQKLNLRPATNGQNMANRKKNLGCSSPYKGVTWSRRLAKWVAQIQADGERRHLGVFADEIDAAKAYDVAACHFFGEYARPNFPGGGESGSVTTSAEQWARPASSSQFRGVALFKDRGRWGAWITRDGKRFYLGSFPDEAEAARAYDAAARELYGNAAALNFPADIPAGAVLLEPREDSAA